MNIKLIIINLLLRIIHSNDSLNFILQNIILIYNPMSTVIFAGMTSNKIAPPCLSIRTKSLRGKFEEITRLQRKRGSSFRLDVVHLHAQQVEDAVIATAQRPTAIMSRPKNPADDMPCACRHKAAIESCQSCQVRFGLGFRMDVGRKHAEQVFPSSAPKLQL